jgi:hypothetical protein
MRADIGESPKRPNGPKAGGTENFSDHREAAHASWHLPSLCTPPTAIWVRKRVATSIFLSADTTIGQIGHL